MTRLALVFVAGSALTIPGAAVPALFLLLLLAVPIGVCVRPGLRSTWLAAALAGALAGVGASRADHRCLPPVRHGEPASLTGRLLARGSRTSPFQVERPRGCRVLVRVTGAEVELGRLVTLHGRWRAWTGGFTFSVTKGQGPSDDRSAERSRGLSTRAKMIRWRGRLVDRLHSLYPERGGVVAALLLARKEGLEPDLREAFARTGTAHLLAISGFHVGVVAVLLLLFLRGAGVRKRRAGLLAAAGVWAYVSFIGLPAAAVRAALILTATAVSRSRGRPPARWGALGLALLLLTAVRPGSLSDVGFQLSFAGAGSLVLWGPRMAGALRKWSGGRLPRELAAALGAGIAATLGTLPVVAWHFERISLVGIPATLAASPLIVLALPGALASLALDFVSPALATFLAGGVDVLLRVLTGSTRWLAGHGWASIWVTRSWVAVAATSGGAALLLGGDTRIRPWVRRAFAGTMALAAVLAWPLLQGAARRGTLELLMIDVGQGDAMALRTPRGRWILVDAGPPSRSGDDGAVPAVRALRRRGVRDIEMLVLTHPDLDHIGGAAAVIGSFAVRRVLDPAVAAGKDAYLDVLTEAASRGIEWTAAAAGQTFGMDGVVIEVLSPPAADEPRHGPVSANESSVVLRVRYGDFDAILTGDAPVSVERGIAPGLEGDIEVLKVGHHGSDTSTDSLFLARAGSRLALVSVGRGNRYGHPSPAVLSRLGREGLEVYRTDLDGTVRVRARPDGRFTVDTRGRQRR